MVGFQHITALLIFNCHSSSTSEPIFCNVSCPFFLQHLKSAILSEQSGAVVIYNLVYSKKKRKLSFHFLNQNHLQPFPFYPSALFLWLSSVFATSVCVTLFFILTSFEPVTRGRGTTTVTLISIFTSYSILLTAISIALLQPPTPRFPFSFLGLLTQLSLTRYTWLAWADFLFRTSGNEMRLYISRVNRTKGILFTHFTPFDTISLSKVFCFSHFLSFQLHPSLSLSRIL